MTATYLREFETSAANGGGAAPSWIRSIRQGAIDRFAQVGFPTSRDEEWRFTPVAPITQRAFAPAPPAAVTWEQLRPFIFGHAEWPLLVFVNGRYSKELSVVPALPPGVTVGSLARALATGGAKLESHLSRHACVETSPFTALNTAFLRDGALVHVPANVVLEQPVHLMFVTTPDATGSVAHPRNLVVAERNARASVVESYVTLAEGATYFTNAVSEVVAGENAWVEHTRIQRESEKAYHVGMTHVDQARDSHYRSFTFAMGGAMARHNLHVKLNDSNIETLMYGLYLTHGEQVVDNHTAIYHDHPHCNSWEVYKGILDGNSRAVFNGKVFVKPEAQKTDAKQTNRNLLLSEGARVDTKPQLEIFADDVKCTHGATIGRLDPLSLYYLQSRGIDRTAGARLLTYAFAAEVVNEVTLEPVQRELNRLVLERLDGVERPEGAS